LRLGEPGLKKLFKSASLKNAVSIVSGICIFIIVTGLAWMRRNKHVYKYASLMALMAAGFSAMAIQIIILLAFQIIYGYVFYKIGFLLTFFMAGLATGSFWVTGLMDKLKRPLNILTRVNFLFFILSLVLPSFFFWLSASNNTAVSQAGANLAFPLLSVIIGLLAGAQFAIVNKIYIGDTRKVGRVSGTTYGIDLLGSCLGALLTGIFLVPVLGVAGSCFSIAAVNLSVLTILTLAASKPLIS
jgi:spermidine synthase